MDDSDHLLRIGNEPDLYVSSTVWMVVNGANPLLLATVWATASVHSTIGSLNTWMNLVQFVQPSAILVPIV